MPSYRNHIIVGLGGTGGHVLREFKKEFVLRHGDDQPENLRIEYLYVDSSESDLNNESNWKLLGRSFQLPQSSRLSIHVPDLRAIVDNAAAYPGISQWLGSRKTWKEYLDAQQGMRAAGGQRRRLGRLLFAHNVERFNSSISNLYNKVVSGGERGQAGSSGVTFHVVCGLAGGTGSGSIIDAVAQIGRFISERKAESQDRIILYGYLPEENPPKAKNEKYYIPNGYAALVELNALSAGRFLPFDVSGQRRFKEGEFMPFNGCYVFTNQTESNNIFHPDDMPGMLSNFLFQKIVAVGDTGAWDTLVRAENSENGIPDCEPRVGPDGTKPPGERSVRFMTFGIKRIAVPEAEIQEYLTYGYGVEVIRQILFNNWSAQFGFSDKVRNSDFKSYREDSNMSGFRCSWDHLLLYRPILTSDVKYDWKTAKEYWGDFVHEVQEDIVGAVDKKFWLDELRDVCRGQFEQEYRIDGAKRFYDQKRATIAIEAAEVVESLEAELLQELLDGKVSITEIAGSQEEDRAFKGIVEVIKDEIRERRGRAKQKEAAARKAASKIEEVLNEIQAEYAKVWMIDPLNRRGKLLEEFKQAITDYMTEKVDEMAFGYAKELCPLIENRLDTLYGEVTQLQGSMTNLFEEFLDDLKKRCAAGSTPDYGRPDVKYYDGPKVRGHLADVRITEALMTKVCGEVRKAIVAELGFDKEQPRFKTFNSRLSNAEMEPLLEQICTRESRADHEIKYPSSEDKLLGVDLVPRLLQEFSTEEKRKSFAENLMVQATNLGALDGTEHGNITANPDPQSIIRRSMSVLAKGLVSSPENPLPEIRPLVQALTVAPPGDAGGVDFVETPSHANSMVVVSLTNILPLRCLKRTAFLRSRYDKLLGHPKAEFLDSLFLHVEGDGSQFPGLFAITMNEVRERGGRLLLMAISSLVVEYEDEGGKSVLYFRQKDDDGVVVDSKRLGNDLVQSIEELTPDLFAKLSEIVDARMQLIDQGKFEVIDQGEQKVFGLDEFKKKLAAQMIELQSSDDISPQEVAQFRAAYNQIKEDLEN